MQFRFDNAKSRRLKRERGISFEEAKALFYGPYYLDQIRDCPEQWVAIGWVNGKLYSVIYEEREDIFGPYFHLVTLWKSTRTERAIYEENS